MRGLYCCWCKTWTMALIPSRWNHSFGQCPVCRVILTQYSEGAIDGLRLEAYVDIIKQEDEAFLKALDEAVKGYLNAPA